MESTDTLPRIPIQDRLAALMQKSHDLSLQYEKLAHEEALLDLELQRLREEHRFYQDHALAIAG